MRKTLRNIVLGLGLFATGCGGGGGDGSNSNNPTYTRSEAIAYLKAELENKGYIVFENEPAASIFNPSTGFYVDNVYELHGAKGSHEFYLDIPEVIPENTLEALKLAREKSAEEGGPDEPYLSIVYELDARSLSWTIEDIVNH